MDNLSTVLFPSIYWRHIFQDIPEDWTSAESPAFSFLEQSWRLKFIFRDDQKKGLVILKRFGGKVKFGYATIETTTAVIDVCIVYYSSKLRLNINSSDEFIIWELRNADEKHHRNDVLRLFRENSIFLKLDIIPGCSWPEKSLNVAEPGGPKETEFSPCISSLCHDFRNMFNNHLMSDVILKCRGQQIYAHRTVLAARSEVFAAMFRSDMREAKEKTVAIEDVEPSVLEQMVRYMYSGDTLDLTPENVHKLYVAADKYGVDALKMKCGVFMVEDTGETIPASTAVVAAGESGEGIVKEAVLSHFANVRSLFGTDEWKKLSEKEPKFAHEAFQFFLSKSF